MLQAQNSPIGDDRRVDTIARQDLTPDGHFYIQHTGGWPFAMLRQPLLDHQLTLEVKGVYAELCALADGHDGMIYASTEHLPQDAIQTLIDAGYIGR